MIIYDKNITKLIVSLSLYNTNKLSTKNSTYYAQ